MTAPLTPVPEPGVGGHEGGSRTGPTPTRWHRHAYPTGPDAPDYLSFAAYRDGHDGPCDSPHAVLLLDLREPDTLKALQRALDDQPGVGLRSLARAVESLLSERVS